MPPSDDHNKLARRYFISASSCLASLTALGLVGCGRQPELATGVASAASPASEPKIMKDIQTYVQGNRGFRGGILKARDIVAGNSVTLYVDEGSHRHPYELTTEQYNQLIAGETITMNTARAAGHQHRVVIDPNYNPANADSVEVPSDDDSNDDVVETIPAYAAVSEADDPAVFVSADKLLEPDSVEYCLGSADACAADSAWTTMTEVRLDRGRQAFRTPAGLEPQDQAELRIRGHERGIDGSSQASAMKLLLKFIAKS